VEPRPWASTNEHGVFERRQPDWVPSVHNRCRRSGTGMSRMSDGRLRPHRHVALSPGGNTAIVEGPGDDPCRPKQSSNLPRGYDQFEVRFFQGNPPNVPSGRMRPKSYAAKTSGKPKKEKWKRCVHVWLADPADGPEFLRTYCAWSLAAIMHDVAHFLVCRVSAYLGSDPLDRCDAIRCATRWG
jgi:hypothetical protein